MEKEKLCLSCIREKSCVPVVPNPWKCRKDGCNSSHNTFFHGLESICPSKSSATNNSSSKVVAPNSIYTFQRSIISISYLSAKNITIPSVSNIKVLRADEMQLSNSCGKDTTALVFRDIFCSKSWVSNSPESRHLQSMVKYRGGYWHHSVELTVTSRNLQTFEPFIVSLTWRKFEFRRRLTQYYGTSRNTP